MPRGKAEHKKEAWTKLYREFQGISELGSPISAPGLGFLTKGALTASFPGKRYRSGASIRRPLSAPRKLERERLSEGRPKKNAQNNHTNKTKVGSQGVLSRLA